MASPLDPSPLDTALARVGDRWTLLVVDALLAGPRRFTELSDGLGGIATNVLSQRLKALAHDGLVVASPYSERPLRMSYQLSAAGHELAGALRLLAQWGARGAGDEDRLRHAACGTAVEARWYCRACDTAVDDAGIEGSNGADLHYL
ncbi:MAG: winged helix-turn-helix transcriptional regulator [Acidimicrobiales bacterium]